MENESKIRKVLFNEVTFVIAVVGVVSSVIFWITNPQNENEKAIIKLQAQIESAETVTAALERIKNNDLHEMQLRMDRIESRQIEQIEAIARLEALIKASNIMINTSQ